MTTPPGARGGVDYLQLTAFQKNSNGLIRISKIQNRSCKLYLQLTTYNFDFEF